MIGMYLKYLFRHLAALWDHTYVDSNKEVYFLKEGLSLLGCVCRNMQNIYKKRKNEAEPRGSASLGPLPRRLALHPVVPRHWGTSCMRGVTGVVGGWGGPWLIIVAFAKAASYFPRLRRRCPVPRGGFCLRANS